MPWIDHYPPGVDWNAPLRQSSLPRLFDEAVAEYPSRPCTNFLGKELTYAEIGVLADRFAAGLQAQGFGRGHRIGLLLPNTPYYVVAYFAILKIGAVVVNFNPLYTVHELSGQTRDSGVVAMVTLDLEMLSSKVDELLASHVLPTAIVCPFLDLLPPVKRLLFRLFKSRDLANISTPPPAGTRVTWDELIDNDGHFEPAIIRPTEDVALLQYTGGTTGVPKGAMLTHANLTANVEQVLVWARTSLRMGEERIIGILPFFHVFAMTAVMNLGIRVGATLILMPRFELNAAIKTIRSSRPTIMPGVPTLYSALLNAPKLRKNDLSSLRFCISGGAPLPVEVRRRFQERTGSPLVEGYGLSETSPVATCNPLEGIEKEGSIGQPLPSTRIAIRSLDGTDRFLPIGSDGEICIAGPQVMKGYWNRPEETASSMVEGFFRTGDVGHFDGDGFVYVIDRIKDLINCSGFKVYPRVVEEAVHAHPAVAEVTVIGIPDAYRGEAPKAFIRLKPGATVTAEEILKHLETRLSRIEMPSQIEFRDELPKTMVGKLSKKELRSTA